MTEPLGPLPSRFFQIRAAVEKSRVRATVIDTVQSGQLESRWIAGEVELDNLKPAEYTRLTKAYERSPYEAWRAMAKLSKDSAPPARSVVVNKSNSRYSVVEEVRKNAFEAVTFALGCVGYKTVMATLERATATVDRELQHQMSHGTVVHNTTPQGGW